jgi:hypothetical protein
MDLSQVTEWVCKKLLNSRTFYHFWKAPAQIFHLLGVADLVCGDEFEPFIEIERAHERMPPTVEAQVTLLCFGQENECAFACFSKLSQQFFLVAERCGFECRRRFEAQQSNLCKPYRQMHTFPQWKRTRRFLHDVIGGAEDGALNAN